MQGSAQSYPHMSRRQQIGKKSLETKSFVTMK